jgi:hypothetical protein
MIVVGVRFQPCGPLGNLLVGLVATKTLFTADSLLGA